MATCLNELAQRMGRREIVVIFSDFFTDLAGLESAIGRMRYHRHEVVLVQVLHHDELTFQFDRMTKFVGLEIPDELLAQPEDLRRGYLRAMHRLQRATGGDGPAEPLRAGAGRHLAGRWAKPSSIT